MSENSIEKLEDFFLEEYKMREKRNKIVEQLRELDENISAIKKNKEKYFQGITAGKKKIQTAHPPPCGKCGHISPNNNARDRHINTCNGVKPGACRICGVDFKKPGKQQKHKFECENSLQKRLRSQLLLGIYVSICPRNLRKTNIKMGLK